MTRACTVGRLADGPFNRRRREVDQTYGWCTFAKDWQAEHAACSERHRAKKHHYAASRVFRDCQWLFGSRLGNGNG
jgi:hypothetical protein